MSPLNHVRCSVLVFALVAACTSTATQRPETPPPVETAGDQEVQPLAEVPAEDLALAALPIWLTTQNDLRSFSRTELVAGTWLVWLRHSEDSTLCLQIRDESLRCWREAGQVTRVMPYGWAVRSAESEPSTEGYLAVLRDGGRTVFSAVRTHPEMSRALASAQPLLMQARPSWWPSPYRIEPQGRVAVPRWRALALVEPPDAGPLLDLVVKALHIQGRERVAEREDSIVVARSGQRRVLCAHQQAWTCSVPFDIEDGGEPYQENEYLDAYDINGTSVAVVRSVRRLGSDTPTGDIPASESGSAYLELWERAGVLEYRGRVHLGRATWRTERNEAGLVTRRVERVIHSVHVESDGCLRIDAAASAYGEADAEFNMRGRITLLNLARAGESIEFSDGDGAFADLGGRWRVSDSGLTRVSECIAESQTLLAPVTIPAELFPPAATCLAILNERIDEWPTMSVATGQVCGATEHRHGVVMGHQRYRYDGDRRVEEIRVFRIQSGGESRYVERKRLFWRRGRRAGHDLESTHFRGDQEECRNTFRRRDTLDSQSRPTRIQTHSATCEGVDAGDHVERRVWHSSEGFDMVTHNHNQRFYVPSYIESVAEVSCGPTTCVCHVNARDESGQVRVRLKSGDPGARLGYRYACPSQPWPTSSEALRLLSIEATFDAEP